MHLLHIRCRLTRESLAVGRCEESAPCRAVVAVADHHATTTIVGHRDQTGTGTGRFRWQTFVFCCVSLLPSRDTEDVLRVAEFGVRSFIGRPE